MDDLLKIIKWDLEEIGLYYWIYLLFKNQISHADIIFNKGGQAAEAVGDQSDEVRGAE